MVKSYATHLLILFVVVVVVVVVVILFVLITIVVFFVIGLILHVLRRLFFALHPALRELLHHFQKFLPIVFQKIVRNREDVTCTWGREHRQRCNDGTHSLLTSDS